MFTTLLQSLILASGGILSIGSITIVILLLISDRGWRNGLAYMSGYVTAYALIGLSAILIGVDRASDISTDSNSESRISTASILLIILGLLLLWMAFRNWRKPPEANPKPPRIFSILDTITPLKALAFGAAVTVINFKNLAIFLSAISIVLVSDLQLPEKIAIVLLDVLIFCASVIIPVLIYLSFPERANERLNRLKQTLEAYSRPIGIWVPLIFGFIFVTRGVSSLL